MERSFTGLQGHRTVVEHQRQGDACLGWGIVSRKKKTGKEVSIVRSSAAEYLTFVAASGSGGVEAVYADESICLTQKMMTTLYDVDVRTVNYHLKKIFSDSELQEDSVIRNFRITAADGTPHFHKMRS